MSLAGTALVLFVIYQTTLHLYQKKALPSALKIGGLWISMLTIHTLVLGPHSRFSLELGRFPLWIIPCLPLLRPFDKSTQESFTKKILATACIAYAVVLVISLYQVLWLKAPVTGFFNNPIYQAYALLPMYLWSLGLTSHYPRAKILCLIIGVSLVLTISRAPTAIAMIATLGLAGPPILRHWGWTRFLCFLLAMAAVFGAIIVTNLSPTLTEKFFRTLSFQDPSMHWRMVAWNYNWGLFLENPWFGVGAGRNGIDTAVQTHLAGHWEPHHLIFAHNVFIQWLAESGIIGTSLAVLYFLSLARTSRSLAMLILFVALAGLTENIFQNSKAFHPFLLALALLQWTYPRSEKLFTTRAAS